MQSSQTNEYCLIDWHLGCPARRAAFVDESSRNECLISKFKINLSRELNTCEAFGGEKKREK
jgi:hypothetical protein